MMDTGLTVLGAHVVTPGRDLGVVGVRAEKGKIVAVGPDVRPTAGDEVIDAGGLTLLPGFVDIHSHGRGGHDFCDATDDAFDAIGRGKLEDGVTGFLATGLTRPEEELAEQGQRVKDLLLKMEQTLSSDQIDQVRELLAEISVLVAARGIFEGQ